MCRLFITKLSILAVTAALRQTACYLPFLNKCNMAIEYKSEEMYDKYRLTDEQIKACKKVYRAMREAGKLGVQFWDMYGTLQAYNGKVFRGLSMDDIPNGIQIINAEASELTYYETLSNFQAGCSDDDVWAELRNGR